MSELELPKELATRMSRDLREAAKKLTTQEIRFLVDTYYQMQKDRIAASNRALAMAAEPHAMITWLAAQSRKLEADIAVSLDVYSSNHPIGAWARSIVGIGPILASGLLAHIDITKARTAGDIWAFAGLNPEVTWEKGQRRPWNARLKTICYLIGTSFIYTKNRENAFYGKVFSERKQYETEKNEKGEYASQAAAVLARKKFDKTTAAYKAYINGKLPAAHITARARRYAVKFFLAHLHYVWYTWHYGAEPDLPFKNFVPPPGELPERVAQILATTKA